MLGADRERYAGRHTLVVGAGHSAATTLLALALLAEEVPATRVTWAIRAGDATRAYGGGAADALPARGALGTRLHALVESGRITLLTGFFTHTLTADGESVTVISRDPSGRSGRWRPSGSWPPPATVPTTPSRANCVWTWMRSSAPPGRWPR
nr:hypothetical protein GCM10020093_069370 [Planobispora longispora]